MIMNCVAQLVIESIIESRREQLIMSKYMDDDEDSKPDPINLELHERRYRGKDDCRIFRCFCPFGR
jgi:hypothetical protein